MLKKKLKTETKNPQTTPQNSTSVSNVQNILKITCN
jgi:hypothetical protein